MEYITAEHLEKYEKILQKIDNEYQLCQQLEKQIKQENDKIVAANISLYGDATKNKLFRVNVRVFDSVFELYNHFGPALTMVKNLMHHENCKFYAVEVYVSPVFQDKLADQNWVLNVRIRSSNNVVNQSLNLKSEAFTYPLLAVLPFDCCERNCKVETTLALPSKGFWTSIRLEDVLVDLSYHFKIGNENATNSSCVSTDMLDICRCYCKDAKILQDISTQSILEYSSFYNNSVLDFLKYLFKNSYHRLDVELFCTLEKSTQLNFEIKTYDLKHNTILIHFNAEDNVLKIKGDVRLLFEIKKYLITGMDEKQFGLSKTALAAFNERELTEGHFTEHIVYEYNSLRKKLSLLPL